MPCLNVKKIKIIQACLFSGLSVQLFNFLIAGLECRLLTAFSLCLGFIIAKVKVTQTLNLDLVSQDVLYLL